MTTMRQIVAAELAQLHKPKAIEEKKAKDGTLSPQTQELLKDFGQAMSKNGFRKTKQAEPEPIDTRGREGMANIVKAVCRDLPGELKASAERRRVERGKEEQRKANPSPGQKRLDDFSSAVANNMRSRDAERHVKLSNRVGGMSDACALQALALDIAQNGMPGDSRK